MAYASRYVHLGFEIGGDPGQASSCPIPAFVRSQPCAGSGWPEAPPNISNSFKKLTQMGFLRDVGGRYQAVEGMKVHVVHS
jgi:hypothetical protein